MKIGRWRVSRPCYDKYHRCPGWAGPGTRFNEEGKNWCFGGSLAGYGGAYYHKDGKPRGRTWRNWRFNRCPKCGTFIAPSVIRWTDPGWWKWEADRWKRNIDDWRQDRCG